VTTENDEYAAAVRELEAERTEFLTVAEVATRLNCGRPTIYKLVANGQLPAVRLGNSANPPIRVPEVELNRFVSRSTIGQDLAERAAQLVAHRGEDPGDAEAYAQALKDLDYEAEVFIDRTAKTIAADVEAAHRAAGQRTVGSHQRTGSDVVNVERVMLEELGRLPFPWPVGVQRLGVRGVGLEALRILHDKGLDAYDEADYRKAVKQVIREAINPKREIP
jgi:excisionase family DNA binding protein